MEHANEHWDHIVIGGGSAGCVLAHRLSERTGARILLIEAGPTDRSPLFRVPAATLWVAGNPRYDWRYMSEPDPSRDGRRELCHSGKVLGGGSSINGMIYARGAAQDFDDWALAGATGWGYADVLPYFQRAERRAGGGPLRGHDGPLAVEDPRDIHPTTRRFLAAARAVGIRDAQDYNGARQEGVAIAQLTQRRGMRGSTARAYAGLARHGLVIRTQAIATRLLFAGTRCIGVHYLWRGRERSAHAGEITLTAGALASPKLLMLSGIGDGDALMAHGITVRHSLPGVGRSLSDHIGAGVGAHVSAPTYNVGAAAGAMAVAGARWLLTRRGPATTPLCQAVAFCKTSPTLDRPDIQLMFSPLAIELRGEKLKPYPRGAVGIFVDCGRPNARGSVTLTSSDPLAPPCIRYDLLSDPRDVATLTAGCRLARQILASEPFGDILGDERFPGADVQSDADWHEALKLTSSLFHHPTGTCAIGTDDAAVVDPQLRVHGLDGLRVADASVMPLPINGNTNAATIMVAERAADLILGDRA